jgi:hypothetical protein
MGRKPIIVDEKEFREALDLLESSTTFQSRRALWVAFEQTEFCRKRGIKVATIINRVKEFNIEVKTPAGKRGASLESFRAAGIPLRKGKKVIPTDVIEKIKKHVPEKYHKKLEKIQTGSLKSAIFLKCMDCSTYNMREVSRCTVYGCPLWPHRPFQNNKQGSPYTEEKVVDSDTLISLETELVDDFLTKKVTPEVPRLETLPTQGLPSDCHPPIQ